MNLAIILLLFITILINLFLGLIVFRSSKNGYSRIYNLIVLSVALWALGDLIMLFSKNYQIAYIGSLLFYVAPITTPVAMLLFSIAFPFGLRKKVYYYASFILVLFVSLFVIINGKIFVSDIIIDDPYNKIIPNNNYFIYYSIFLSIFFILTYVSFILRIISSSGIIKAQLIYAFIGVFIATNIALYTNIILPIKGIYSFVWIGPPATIIAGVMIALAIVKYRLFEVKATIIRAMSYLFFIVAIAFVYVFLVNMVGVYVLNRKGVDNVELITNIIVAMILVFTFQPLRKKIDKFTQRIFYRDAYDPQEVLNKLNAQLVKSNSIDELARASIDIIEDNIHPQFVCFVFLDSPDSFSYYYGSKKVKLSYIEEHHLATFVMNDNLRTIVADEVVQYHHIAAKKIFNKHQIALSTKLIAGDEVIGFELLGDRKSGNAFNGRDIQLLETAADSIAIAAQNALRYEEIAEFNITLQKRIEDATHQLQKSNAKLLALDDAKDEFISMASHQLRTPLTSIKGYISMLLEGDGGRLNELQHKFLDQAFISSQRMVYLIADLLNVSRVKTGKFVIEPKPTYLPDVVTSELSQLTETAKARELKLVFVKTPANFPILNLDETKIRQVIMNFADNAIYYTPKGGTISVALGLTNEFVECTVTDTGIGVPLNDQHHLFTKFYRAGNARKARPDGTGLGLFMAKKVIAAQGGTIIFKSVEGKGSAFGFSFPRARLELANQQTDIKA